MTAQLLIESLMCLFNCIRGLWVQCLLVSHNQLVSFPHDYGFEFQIRNHEYFLMALSIWLHRVIKVHCHYQSKTLALFGDSTEGFWLKAIVVLNYVVFKC